MSDDNQKVDISDNLDEFEAQFFQTPAKEEEPEAEKPEEVVEENEETPLATETEDEEAPDEEDEEADENSEAEPEPEPEPKPKRNKTQQRIEQLLERERLANERAIALERRIQELEVGKEEKAKPETNIREQLPPEAPHPDATDKDGEPLYPLGEFDPMFIRDLTKHTIEQETKRAKEVAKQEEQEREFALAQQAIAKEWTAKVDEYAKEVPTVREDVRELSDAFQHIDPGYGEYLATTIMSSEYGPQIMHYLSQNIGEARSIVDSGPAAATRLLGRLEARFISNPKPAADVEPKQKKKVSDAPAPPEAVNRGKGGRYSVNADTDDLDAFEKVFFK